MIKTVSLTAAAICVAAGAQAASFTASPSFSDNAATESAFYSGLGLTGPEFLQDFETGFVDEQRVNGPVGDGLSISGIGIGAGGPKIEQGNGSIGGSNPIGDFALEFTDDGGFSGQNSLVLTFTGTLDYLSFYISDAAAHTITAGGQTFETNGTGVSGNSSLFHGIDFDLADSVTEVSFAWTGAGSAGVGIDNVGFGYAVAPPEPEVIPVPAGLPLLALGLGGLAVLRRRGA